MSYVGRLIGKYVSKQVSKLVRKEVEVTKFWLLMLRRWYMLVVFKVATSIAKISSSRLVKSKLN